MRRRALMSLFSVAAAWPVAAQMQSTSPPSEAMTSSLEKIVIVRVKRIDPYPRPWFRLNDREVDLMKVFSLGGSEGIGATWKMVAPTDQTFDARYGRW